MAYFNESINTIQGILLIFVLLANAVSIVTNSIRDRKWRKSQENPFNKTLMKSYLDDLLEIRAKLFSFLEESEKIVSIYEVSKMRTVLFRYQQQYSEYLSPDDKEHLNQIFSILKNQGNAAKEDNVNSLCEGVDYFIAKFQQFVPAEAEDVPTFRTSRPDR